MVSNAWHKMPNYMPSLSWLLSKLEPGPTLIAYGNLTENQKATWEALDAAFTGILLDEKKKRNIFG